MSVILYNFTTGALMVLLIRVGNYLVTGSRRFPWLAVAGTLALAAGLIVQASWSGAMATLDDDPARAGWWRPFTAVFLQTGGFTGVAFNLVTAAIVLALAEWHWGRLRALALLLVAVLLPQWLDVLSGAGRSTDPRNFVGSSGAVYFLGATLAGALLLAPRGVRLRLLALAVPVGGLALWFAQANGHGLVSAEGFVVGLVVAAVSTGVRALAPTGRAASEPCRS